MKQKKEVTVEIKNKCRPVGPTPSDPSPKWTVTFENTSEGKVQIDFEKSTPFSGCLDQDGNEVGPSSFPVEVKPKYVKCTVKKDAVPEGQSQQDYEYTVGGCHCPKNARSPRIRVVSTTQ